MHLRSRWCGWRTACTRRWSPWRAGRLAMRRSWTWATPPWSSTRASRWPRPGHCGARRTFLLENLHAYRAYRAEADERQQVLPTITFEQRLRIRGSGRTVELVCPGGGHTASDSYLHLPEDRVAIMGDLLAVGRHPAFPHGDPVEWRRILTEVLELDLESLVPGHGPVGTLADVELEHDDLGRVEAIRT